MHDFKPREQTSDGQRVDPWHAIATMYRGYEFRSRLEAKWAVFFDQCGWNWSYEPVDMNGWIPDFAIGETPTLVEVKPFFDESQYTEALEKIARSGYKQYVVMLPADPVWLSKQARYHDAPHIGWVYSFPEDIMWDLNFGFTQGNGMLGLCSMDGAWVNRIWNPPANIEYANKWARVSLEAHEFEQSLVQRWAYACNVAKWVPVKDKQ